MDNKAKPKVRALERRPLLYQTVKEEIKDYITRNALKPGDKLPPETELAQQFGVSRTSVREAVKSLESLGILQARPGAGLCVRSFSFDPLLDNLAYGIMFDMQELKSILEVRFHIEYGMIPRAVEMVDAAQLKQLRDVLGAMREAAAEKRYSEKIDRQFHQTLWSNVENPIVGKILDIFWQVFFQARQRASLEVPEDLMDAHRLHERIVNDLERRDVEAMKQSMDDHHQNILRRVKKLEESLGGRDSG